MRRKILLSLIFSAIFSFVSCKTAQHQQDSADHDGMIHFPRPNSAICVLNPTQGSNVRGVVRFTREGQAIKIVAEIDGLTPGKHGFHIHEFGDCSAPDAASAGGHFNPHNQSHGAPNAGMRHIGDFGNIEADGNGHAHYERLDESINFEGVENIIGHAIIVHANPDDLVSQPSGNAGGRVACGIIGIAK